MVKNKRVVEEGGDIWKSTGTYLKIPNLNFWVVVLSKLVSSIVTIMSSHLFLA